MLPLRENQPSNRSPRHACQGCRARSCSASTRAETQTSRLGPRAPRTPARPP
jgi:hypothetical protein